LPPQLEKFKKQSIKINFVLKIFSKSPISTRYDFFVDYKSIRTTLFREQKTFDFENAPSKTDRETVELLNQEWSFDRTGLKILHWPGELRKPWQRYEPLSRSVFDQMWWDAYHGMCRDSAGGWRNFKKIGKLLKCRAFLGRASVKSFQHRRWHSLKKHFALNSSVNFLPHFFKNLLGCHLECERKPVGEI